MTLYRTELPQLRDRLFLTDGGLETCLIFHEDIDLPLFAAIDQFRTPTGRQAVADYYRPYIELALQRHLGFILESPTWRSSAGWGGQLGYSSHQLDQLNNDALALMDELRLSYQTDNTPMVISGCIGPRGDGYQVGEVMSAEESQRYHQQQIEQFASGPADMVSAITMTYTEEAIGIAKAAQEHNIPSVISFTTETDGRLPSGEGLAEAIETVDEATGNGPAYYMVNCAHPDHFSMALEDGRAWVSRIRGIRANASRCSHAELDEAEELDSGDPEELGQLYQQLRRRFPQITVLGGCCGTDHRHLGEIARACC